MQDGLCRHNLYTREAENETIAGFLGFLCSDLCGEVRTFTPGIIESTPWEKILVTGGWW